MASIFANVGKAGAKQGIKHASKQMGKKLAKSASKKVIKKLGKKGLKGMGKKSKKATKKFGKKVGKKAIKKAGKKLKKGKKAKSLVKKIGKKLSKSDLSEKQEEEEVKKTKVNENEGKSGKKRKEKKKGKSEHKEKIETKDVPDKRSKKEKKKGKKDNKKKGKRGKDKLRSITKLAKSKAPVETPDTTSPSETPIASTSTETTSSMPQRIKLDAIPIEHISKVTHRKEVPTRILVTRTESEEQPSSTTVESSVLSETQETPTEISLPSPQAPKDPTPPTRGPTHTATPRRSRVGPVRGDMRGKAPVARRLSETSHDSRSGQAHTGKSIRNILQRSELDKEVAKELNDPEFNLMLFKLAKHIIMDDSSTVPEKRRKKKRKTSEWLQALNLILNAQNGDQCAKSHGSRHCKCSCCPKNEKINAHSRNSRGGLSPGNQGEKAETKTTPRKFDGKFTGSSSSESSSGDFTYSSSSTSYSKRSFRENTSRFCDLVRTLNNNPTTCSCRYSPIEKPNPMNTYQTQPGPTYQQPPCYYPSTSIVPYCINPCSNIIPNPVCNIQINPTVDPSICTGEVFDQNLYFYPDYFM